MFESLCFDYEACENCKNYSDCSAVDNDGYYSNLEHIAMVEEELHSI